MLRSLSELRRRVVPTQQEELADSSDWRERMLFTILAVVLVFGTATALPSIWLAWRAQEWAIVGVDLAAMAAAAVLTFHSRIPFAWRAGTLMVITYALGLFLLVSGGAVGQTFLMAVPILSALLLGLRPAVVALALCTMTVGVAGYLGSGDAVHFTLGPTASVHWFLVALNFLFVDAVITISSAILLRRLERSLEREERTSKSLTRLGRAMEQAQEGILVADRTGAVVYSNAAAADLVGIEMEAGTSTQWLQDLPANDAALVDAIAAGREWTGTVVRIDPTGERRELEASVTPVVDTEMKLHTFAAVLRDVTHERAMEERLRRGQKLEAVGTLAGGIAHDFNNIIASILAVAELQREEDRGSRDTAATDQIILACTRARDIVRKMMAFSRQAVPIREPIGVAEAAAEALPLLRASIPATVQIESLLEATGLVAVDPSEIHQILMNLGTNGAHAMGSGGGTLRFSVTDIVADVALAAAAPRLTVGAPYVRIEVTDTGHGIRAEHLERIFDPFFSTKHPTEGTGLGLASVHGIVRSLEGEIHVYSVVGLGSTFQIHLPTASVPSRLPIVAPPARRDAKWGLGLSVMVVDDEATLREAQRRALERVGFTVVTAAHGREALALLGNAQFPLVDVMITDLSMPEMGGDELIRATRVTHPALKVILTSGFAMTRHQDDLSALHPDAFLQKPYGLEDLLRAVRSVLDRAPLG